LIYHVLNRAAGKGNLFRDEEEFAAFIRALHETLERTPIRLCAFCVMSNHWHLVLWPEKDGELARFMQRLTITHVRRWVEHRHRVGYGSVYQGRYKSFAVQDDSHFLTLVRYVEGNPLREKMVKQAQKWRWSSLGQSAFAASEEVPQIPICRWPVKRRRGWLEWVNQPQTSAEMEAVAHAIKHNRPYGSPPWTARVEKRLGLGPLRKRGRPKKIEKESEK
jgi:putative transposase